LEQMRRADRSQSRQQFLNRSPRLFRELKRDRSTRLFLNDGCSLSDGGAGEHVVNAKTDQIASPKLAVQGHTEKREIAG
jgi:hypothetical protein